MTVASDSRVSLTPRAAEIARVARDLLEAEGIAALSMRNIAAKLGIRAASLYEHFADKAAVENAVMAAAMYDQGDFIAERLDGVEHGRILAIARAFRDHALAHPELYNLVMSRSLDRTAPDVAAAEEWAGSAIRAEVGTHREISLALWSFSHGMVDLEIKERFPPGFDIDAVWTAGISALTGDLEAKRSADA